MEVRLTGTGAILSERLSASALIDGRILIDTPNGLMKSLRRSGLDARAIDVCLYTHFHADHFLDVVFLFAEQGLRRKRDTELVIVGPQGLAERVEKLYLMSYPESWERIKSNVKPKYIEFDEAGGVWEGLGYKIRALPVDHPVPIAFGYIITDSAGAKLGYTGDTVYCPSVEEIAANCDLLVADSAFLTSRSGHMGLEDVEALADRWPDRSIIATHLSEEVKESIKRNIAFPVDGQVFEVRAGAIR